MILWSVKAHHTKKAGAQVIYLSKAQNEQANPPSSVRKEQVAPGAGVQGTIYNDCCLELWVMAPGFCQWNPSWYFGKYQNMCSVIPFYLKIHGLPTKVTLLPSYIIRQEEMASLHLLWLTSNNQRISSNHYAESIFFNREKALKVALVVEHPWNQEISERLGSIHRWKIPWGRIIILNACWKHRGQRGAWQAVKMITK